MSSKTDTRLTSGQRLGRGLRYTAVGPVDVTRGALGVGLHSVASSAAWVGNQYRRSRIKDQLEAAQEAIAQELAAAQDVVSDLPSAFQKARSRRRTRPLLLAAFGVVTLAGGAVAFAIIRRSTQPEPSPLPPSVEVSPKP